MNSESTMQLEVLTLSKSRHPDRDFDALRTWGFEPFMYVGSMLLKADADISKAYPEYQLLVYDKSKGNDDLIGFCETVPLDWDGTLVDVPFGYDAAIERHLDTSRRPFNTLSGRAIVVRDDMRGRGLSHLILNATIALASKDPDIKRLLIPVRPSLKSNYPLVPIEEYVKWKTDDGRVFDPWLRVHLVADGRILGIAHRSLVIQGTIAQWMSWTYEKYSFDKDGSYIIHGALTPLEVNLSRDIGTYVEPNILIEHKLTKSMT